MNEYLKKLQEEYGYSKELTEVLGNIIPAFVEHFGQENEQLILDAISSCEIHMQEEKEKPEEYLSEFFPDKDIEKLPTMARAFYESMPIINNDNISSKRLIYMRNSDLQSETTITTLVHEMGHLIKAYDKEYLEVDGKIQKRDGISTTIMTKDKETGKYISKEESNTAIEEAINCYDEEKIMSIILDREFADVNYSYHFNEAINPLFKNQELVTAFRNAQLHGTDEHIKLIGKEDFEKLSEYCEKIYHPFVASFSELKNGGTELLKKEREEAKKAIIDYSNKYRENKEKNFSLENIEELDKTVSFKERENGMKTLKEIMQKTQEKAIIVEEKENDSRI